MTKRRKFGLTWLLYIVWALFINAINVWIIIPLAEDFAILGVVAIVVLVVLWLTSIPQSSRRRWISFSLYSLMLGYGLSSISNYPIAERIEIGILMIVGLLVIAWLFARVKALYLSLAALAIVAANTWLPISEWPFLTHFSVAYYGLSNISSSDFSALPFAPVQTSHGTAIVTVQHYQESKLNFEKAAIKAVESPNALQNLLQNYTHLYRFITVTDQNGRFVSHPTTAQELAKVNVNNLISSFFPFERADWRVVNGKVLQYMSPSVSPQVLAQMVQSQANFPINEVALANVVEQQERQSWDHLLSQLGVLPSTPKLSIVNGVLQGQYLNQQIHVSVPDSKILGYGSFTATGVHEVLLQGANRLDVVSLGTAPGRLVASYRGTTIQPLSNDVVSGPLTSNGRDAVFVNASPAYIVEFGSQQGKVVYTAPNPSLRFEGSVQFKPGQSPEIITDDPSYIRNSPTRYFTSYRFEQGPKTGQLIRNWRVYHTNLVNVQLTQFQPGKPPYVVAAIYGTSKFVILRRSYLPVLPGAIALLAGFIVVGWGIRIWGKKEGTRHD